MTTIKTDIGHIEIQETTPRVYEASFHSEKKVFKGEDIELAIEKACEHFQALLTNDVS